jgi:hypothetical protein
MIARSPPQTLTPIAGRGIIRQSAFRERVGNERVVLNRKNSLFVGNPRGGRTAAILASLTSTCRRHDDDPSTLFHAAVTQLAASP